MEFVLASLGCAAVAAVLAVFPANRPARIPGKILELVAAAVLFVPVFRVLYSGQPIRLDGAVGSWAGLGLDPIAALFLMVISGAYLLNTLPLMARQKIRKDMRGTKPEWVRPLFFILSVALLMTRNGLLIALFAEGAALVMTWWRRKTVSGDGGFSRFAGFLQFGILPVLAAEAVLMTQSRALDIGSFAPVLSAQGPAAPLASLLILIGCGSMIGLFPFHGWMEDRSASDTGDRVLFLSLWPLLGFSLFVRLLEGWKNPVFTTVLLIVALGAITAVWAAVMSGRKKNSGSLVFGLDMVQGGLVALGLGAGLAATCCADPYASILGYFGAALAAANRVYSSVVVGASSDASGGTPKKEGLTRSFSFLVPVVGSAGFPLSGGGIAWLVIYMAYFLLSAGQWPVAGIGWAGLAVLAVTQALLIASLRSPVRDIFRNRIRVPGRWMAKIALGIGLAVLIAAGFFPQFSSLFLIHPVFDYAGLEPSTTMTLMQITGSRLFVLLNTVSRYLLALAGVVLILYFIRLFVLVKRDWDRGVKE